MNGISPQRVKYLFFGLLLFISLYIIFSPLIASIDSIEGFLAYKGTIDTGAFNFRTEVSAENIAEDHLIFVSYWSPGQWIFPAIFNYLLNLKLGVASIIVTILFSISGMAGFYKLFRFFKFSAEVSIYSLLLIFCSYTFFYSFIVYQGGEILSFGVFPWFAFYVLSVKNPSFRNLAGIFILFTLCFLAKLTLLIYAPLVIFFKIIVPGSNENVAEKPGILVTSRRLLYVIPVAVSCALIYYFFLTRYVSNFYSPGHHIAMSDILTPLASPLLSILSLQQVAGVISSKMPVLSSGLIYGFLLVLLLLISGAIFRSKQLLPSYKTFLAIMYAGICVFFIYSYLNDQVDQSSRHFKLLGYLFLPGIISIATNRIRSICLQMILFLVCTISLISFVYLKSSWVKGRYISVNYFYRHYDNKQDIDKLDKESYEKLIALAKTYPPTTVFFMLANLDVAMDVPFRYIVPWKNLLKTYGGHGPIIVACFPRELLASYPDFLKRKFPGYSSFNIIGETSAFLFYEGR